MTPVVLRWFPVVSAVLQLAGTALIVWGLEVVSMPRAITWVRDPTPEEIAATRTPPDTSAPAGIAREHSWAFTWGSVLLLAGLTLAATMGVCAALGYATTTETGEIEMGMRFVRGWPRLLKRGQHDPGS